MSARDDDLGRVRQALVDVASDDSVSVPRPTVPGQRVDDLVGLFAQRVADYRASVRRCSPDAAAVEIGELIAPETTSSSAGSRACMAHGHCMSS